MCRSVFALILAALLSCISTPAQALDIAQNRFSSTDIDTSAELRALLGDETGAGPACFADSPVFTTPNIGTATGSVSGNAGTATALAANGANCSAGNYPLGVNASGAAESCTAAGGSSLGPNVKTVCASGCNYDAIPDAANSIKYPVGEPLEAAYQSDATITMRKITADGYYDNLYSAAGPPTANGNTVNTPHILLKCTGSPVGNILLRACVQDTTTLVACNPTTSIPDGETLATATIAASSISTVGPEEKAPSFDVTVPEPSAAGPNWGLIITGDSTYKTGNGDFSANYCELVSYAGGTSLKVSGSGPAGEEGGEPYYGGGADIGVIAAYVVNSSFSDESEYVLQLGPGTYYAGPETVLQPNVSVMSLGRSGVIQAPTGTSGGATGQGIVNRNGSVTIDNIALIGAGISSANGLTWRGEEQEYNLNTDTSTGSTAIVLSHSNSRGDDLVANDVVHISQSGKPTAYYRVISMTHTAGDPGTTTITANRNIEAVYTHDVARVRTWKAPKLLVTNSLVEWEFRAQASAWRNNVVELADNDVRVPLGDFFTEIPAKTVVITRGNRFEQRTAMGGFAADGSVIHVEGGRYESFNDSLSYAGSAPVQAAKWLGVSSGSGRINNLDIRMDVVGANNTLTVARATGTGSIKINGCSKNVVNGTLATAIDGTSATIALKDCNLPGPTLTGSATLAQFTASPAYGSATAATPSTAATAITVPGTQTASKCDCKATVATCIVTTSVATAGVCTASHANDTTCDGKTIRCESGQAL